jgi:hypothetical protein
VHRPCPGGSNKMHPFFTSIIEFARQTAFEIARVSAHPMHSASARKLWLLGLVSSVLFAFIEGSSAAPVVFSNTVPIALI